MIRTNWLSVRLVLIVAGLLTPLAPANAGSFTGFVYENDGTVLTSVTVQIQLTDFGGTQRSTATTDATGKFTITVSGSVLMPTNNKTVKLTFNRMGSPTSQTINGLKGDLATPQTIHVIVP